MKNSLLFFLLILASCSESEKVKINKYFDLDGYFKKEAERLQKGGYKLEKHLYQGAYTETVIIDNADWKKMLSPFMSCDINKPSWVNSYSSDSSVYGDSLKVVYNATEKNLQIRTLEILQVRNVPVEVVIRKARENFYYSSTEVFNYHPDGFVIRSAQKVRLMDEEKYEIKGNFIH